jgi:2-hydroxychromene-2-carboxylate isomerase
MTRPVLYFDLGSPYAYLAVMRAADVLGSPPELEPVLLGAIFQMRGWGSWSKTRERASRIADIEARARSRGLAPMHWPPGWPGNGLAAMRAATWAKREGALEAFAAAVFRRQFADGEDIADLNMLAACAAEAALDPAALPAAIADQTIKDELRRATDAAWAAGVRGIPTLRLGEQVFYGDDQLESAAAALASAPD